MNQIIYKLAKNQNNIIFTINIISKIYLKIFQNTKKD